MRYEKLLQILVKEELCRPDYALHQTEKDPEPVFMSVTGHRYTGGSEQVAKQLMNLISTRVHKEYLYYQPYTRITHQPPLHDTINIIHYTLVGPLNLRVTIQPILDKWFKLFEMLDPPPTPPRRRANSCWSDNVI